MESELMTIAPSLFVELHSLLSVHIELMFIFIEQSYFLNEVQK